MRSALLFLAVCIQACVRAVQPPALLSEYPRCPLPRCADFCGCHALVLVEICPAPRQILTLFPREIAPSWDLPRARERREVSLLLTRSLLSCIAYRLLLPRCRRSPLLRPASTLVRCDVELLSSPRLSDPAAFSVRSLLCTLPSVFAIFSHCCALIPVCRVCVLPSLVLFPSSRLSGSVVAATPRSSLI